MPAETSVTTLVTHSGGRGERRSLGLTWSTGESAARAFPVSPRRRDQRGPAKGRWGPGGS